jgi:hypothetical protein
MEEPRFESENEMIQFYLDNSEKIKEIFNYGSNKMSRENEPQNFVYEQPVLLEANTALRRFSSKHVQPRSIIRLCPHCKNSDLYSDTIHADLVCKNCATCMDDSLVDDAYRCMPYEDYGILMSNHGIHKRRSCYKKTDYLSDILRSINAHNCGDVPLHVLQLVNSHMKKNKPASVKDVRAVLKHNKLQKFYNRAAFIKCKVNEFNGKESPKPLTYQEETRLRCMFGKFSSVYEKQNTGRKNSLNYNYVVGQLLKLIGRSDLTCNLSIVKCRKRLHMLDHIWAQSCESLQWPFHHVH